MLLKLTGVTQKRAKEVEALQQQHNYFAHLAAEANHSGEVNVDWFNALLGRVFWSIHNHDLFINFVKEKFKKKILKLKKPKFVVCSS